MASVSEKNLVGESRHEHLIQSLAQESDAPLDEVRELFEIEHARLQAKARVKTYVAVIATRLVRNSLHARAPQN